MIAFRPQSITRCVEKPRGTLCDFDLTGAAPLDPFPPRTIGVDRRWEQNPLRPSQQVRARCPPVGVADENESLREGSRGQAIELVFRRVRKDQYPSVNAHTLDGLDFTVNGYQVEEDFFRGFTLHEKSRKPGPYAQLKRDV